MEFSNLKQSADKNVYAFTLSPVNVAYANTLRRIILTGIETVAFRSDMSSTGTTTDVFVKRNDTPMTNEMLADRIGLIPIYVTKPNEWKEDKYKFILKVDGTKDNTKYVTASDFKVIETQVEAQVQDEDTKVDEDNQRIVPTEQFFPVNPITNSTCLIATLQPGAGSKQQSIDIIAKATKGTGREHARFSPVSQCSYEYSLLDKTNENDKIRIDEMFMQWLLDAKKISAIDKTSARYAELDREFNTMQIKRCFKTNEKEEPYSFDFTIETIGILSVPYIVERACEVGENMCSRYTDSNNLPREITISHADSKLIGYDFRIPGHDHTLGNLLQTWLVENHIEGTASPKIEYAGYAVPHPLRDEMVLRIGVEDGNEKTAKLALANAAKGCVEMFQKMRIAWRNAIGAPSLKPVGVSSVKRRQPRVGSLSASAATSAASAATATVKQ